MRSPVRVLTLTYLDEAFTNAQQVNGREIIARLDPAQFFFTAFARGPLDWRLQKRPNLVAVRLHTHGKAPRVAWTMLSRHDVIWYPHGGPAEAFYLRALRPLLPRARRPKLVLPIEGDVAQLDEVPATLRRRIERLIRVSDVVVPITAYVAETVKARFGRTGPIIPVGVDTRVFTPWPEATGRQTCTVATVGTLKPWKRTELAIEAARRFPAHRFLIAGDGPERSRLEGLAPANVEFLGTVSRDEMPRLLAGCHVLLHPSRMEGMPKVVLEGMACGLPPVLFDCYRPDFVSNGESGFVVSTEAEMLEALGVLIDNPSKRLEMGARARQASEQYSWEAVARLWGGLFESLAGRGSTASLETDC